MPAKRSMDTVLENSEGMDNSEFCFGAVLSGKGKALAILWSGGKKCKKKRRNGSGGQNGLERRGERG